MLINVTQEHITKGLPIHNEFCMVALAIKDATGKRVSVTHNDVTLFGTFKRYSFGPEVSKRIETFDSGQEVTPFTFDLETGSLVSPVEAEPVEERELVCV